MGSTFPLANAHVQRVQSSVGGHAGALYLANTLGNVAGSILTGFLLLPLLGQQNSITFLAVVGALGLVPLYLTMREAEDYGTGRWLVLACALLFGITMTYWVSTPSGHLLKNIV